MRAAAGAARHLMPSRDEGEIDFRNEPNMQHLVGTINTMQSMSEHGRHGSTWEAIKDYFSYSFIIFCD